ncbi:MAG: hypothetical protein P4L50_05390, partial [Anaerolineaceae bacterium]|nr:hypothetical protein [Anaerolineaceae bacterium]
SRRESAKTPLSNSDHAEHLSYNILTSSFPLPLCGMLRFVVRLDRNAQKDLYTYIIVLIKN